jgi:hypothetical protein
MHKPEGRAKQARTIRAELVGATGCHCAVAGLYACANTPVLEMCRLLVSAGFHPGSTLVCFRGGTLSLTVHSIGDASRLKVNSKGTGFERVSGVRMASPMRKSHTARTSVTPTTIQSGCPVGSRNRSAGEYRVRT